MPAVARQERRARTAHRAHLDLVGGETRGSRAGERTLFGATTGTMFTGVTANATLGARELPPVSARADARDARLMRRRARR